MAIVTVSDVRLCESDGGEVARFQLDEPTAGSTSDVYAVTLQGWVLTRSAPPERLELSGPGIGVVHLPIGVPRPDLEGLYPDIPWSTTRSGFRVEVGVLGLPTEFEFLVSVVLVNKQRLPVATVRGRHETLAAGDSADISPILVTTLGRTGSTVVMKMLGAHPEVVIYPLFVTETKVASYWADVFLALTEPRSYLQAVNATASGEGHWWLGERRSHDAWSDDPAYPALRRWLGATQVPEIARFCRQRINAFYQHVAELEGVREPRYFAEKSFVKLPADAQVLREMYPETREIILVRDFRDMLCSMFAYSRRLESQLFGREMFDSDEEYVKSFLAKQIGILATGWRERSDSAHLLRYEDLILEPRKAILSLLSYLDLDSEDTVVERLLAELEPAEAHKDFHGTSANVRDSIGRWREELDPSLRPVCEETFAEALDAFGYSR